MISTSGVREGLLYEMLHPAQRQQDPLLVAAAEFNQLFSARRATPRIFAPGPITS